MPKHINLEEATEVASKYVRSIREYNFEINGEHTEEHEFGWVFYYDEIDGDDSFIPGVMPIIVTRNGVLVQIPSAGDPEAFIEDYAIKNKSKE